MKENRYVFLIILCVLILTQIACGSSATPVVTTDVPEVPQAPIPENPTISPLGSSRDNPAPVGTTVTVDDMSFQVNGVSRNANDYVLQGNMFNSTPEPGQEYIVINISVTCQKSSNDKCQLFSGNLKVVGNSGNVSDQGFVSGIEGQMETMPEFFGGASIKGNLIYKVKQTDNSLVLEYDPFLGNPMYMYLTQ